MIGEDDHSAVDNEPVTAEDLFGDNLFDDDNENEPSNENATNNQDNNADTSTSQTPAATTKKSRVINRLPNLNDVWLTDSRRESIRKVNGYFDKIKFRKGKNQERENLKLILQKYEYFGQNCYPKLCFKDFVEKVESVSGKRSIKHVLQDIRNGRDFVEDPDSDDNAEPEMNVDEPTPALDADKAQNPFPNSPSRDSPSPPPPDIEPTPPPKPITDEMREFIRKKREEALAKRQQKLNDSMNQSTTSPQDDDKDVSQNNDNEDDNQLSHNKEAEKENSKSNSNEKVENSEPKNNQTEKEVNMESDSDSLDGILPEISEDKNSQTKKKDIEPTDNGTETPSEIETDINETSGKNEDFTNKTATEKENNNKNGAEDDNTMDVDDEN